MYFKHVIRTSVLTAGLLMLGSTSLLAQNVTLQQDAKKGTWGYSFPSGKWAVKPKYDSALPFEKFPDNRWVSKVSLKGLSGYVDENGKPLGAGIIFESIERLSDNALLVKTKGKYGVVNNAMTYILKPEMTEVNSIDADRFIVNTKGKFGIINRKGQYLLDPLFSSIDLSIPNFIRVMKGNKCGLYSQDYKMVIEPKEFTAIEPYFNYWKVYKDKKVGLYSTADKLFFTKVDYQNVDLPINISGQFYTPIQKPNGKWGAVTKDGKERLKCRYNEISAIPELKLFFVTRKGFDHRLWFPAENVFLDLDVTKKTQNGPFQIISGYLDTPTTEPPARIYSSLRLDEVFDWDTTYPVRRKLYNELFPDGVFNAILNKDGKLVSSSSSTSIKNSDGYYFLSSGYSSNDIYDPSGSLVMKNAPRDYKASYGWLFFNESALSPDHTIFPVMQVDDMTAIKLPSDGRWHLWNKGVTDANGYQTLKKEDSFVHALRDGKWGILKNGRETIKCLYPQQLKYSSDLKKFIISENGYMGLMDDNGNITVRPEYDDLSLFDSIDGIILAKKDNKNGLLSAKGEVLFPVEYDSFKYTGISNHLWVLKDNLYGVYEDTGRKIFDIKYRDEEIGKEEKYYKTMIGGRTQYYYSDGSAMDQTPYVDITSLNMDHNVYVDGNKSLRMNFNCDTRFLKDKPVYAELLIYNANGTPARKSNGQQIKWGYWITPSYLFSCFSNQWISIPYTNFHQPRGSKRDYYGILRFQNGNGKVYSSSNKVTFYVTK